MEKSKGGRTAVVLQYVAAFLVVGAIVYALVNGILAASLGLPGGIPQDDLEASLIVGMIGILLLGLLAVYRRVSRNQSRHNILNYVGLKPHGSELV